jgi:hypothetical protein
VDPTTWISYDRLFRKPNEPSFVIDIFSKDSLETFTICFIKLRAIIRQAQKLDHPRLMIGLVGTLVFISFLLGVIALGYE